jgi:hypothetical protein
VSTPAILAEFAAAATGAQVKGDVVLRKAPVVFRAGHYLFSDAPSYTMTAEDIRAACEEFEPVGIVDTHVPSIFNAKLGDAKATRLLPSEDFSQFGAEVEVPLWFHQLFGDEPIPVSANFDRETKRLTNIALVPNPRITDAALFAAFAAEDARRSIPQPSEAPMSAATPTAPPTPTPSPTPPPAPNPPSTPAPAPAPVPAPAEASAREIELEARVKALEAQREVDRQSAFAAEVRRIDAEAASFAREQVIAGRAYPAQRQDVADDYRQAALDDLTHKGEVTFSSEDGKTRQKGGRLDALRARWRRTPAHRLREEVVTDNRLAAVFAEEPPTAEADEEAKAHALYLLTPTGRQAAREAARASIPNGTNGKE